MEEETRRVNGYVVGCDLAQSSEKLVCRVRVKDPTSPHDGQKFTVASVHGGIELAQGLNVTFVLGTIDGPAGEKVTRAVDVRLESPTSTTSTSTGQTSQQEEKDGQR